MEHSTESIDSSLKSPGENLSNSLLHFTVATPILKLHLLKVVCLQGHKVIGKNDQVPCAFKAHSKKCLVLTHLYPRARGSKHFLSYVMWVRRVQKCR